HLNKGARVMTEAILMDNITQTDIDKDLDDVESLTPDAKQVYDILMSFEDPFSKEAKRKAAKETNSTIKDIEKFLDDELRDIIRDLMFKKIYKNEDGIITNIFKKPRRFNEIVDYLKDKKDPFSAKSFREASIKYIISLERLKAFFKAPLGRE